MTYGRIALAMLLLLAPPLASAGGLVFRVDPAASEVRFALGATLHTARGTFKVKSGEVSGDPEKGELSGAIVVDAASGNTENSSRDRKMHEEVLESAKFPEIVFVARKLEGTVKPDGTASLTISGLMRLHGGEHAFSTPVTVTLAPGRAVVDGTFRIPYVEWGLSDPSVFLLRVAKDVEVTIHIVGVVEPR